MTFLAPSNATVQTINKYVIETLFEKEAVLRYIMDGSQTPMPVYKNMTVMVTESRYFPSWNYAHFIKITILFFTVMKKLFFSLYYRHQVLI